MTYQHFRELGNDYFRKRRYREAIKSYKKGIEICPNKEKHLLLSNTSIAYLRLQKFDQSLEFAKKCVEMKPDFEKGYVRMIRSYIGKGEYEHAKKLTFCHVTNLDVRKSILSSIEKVWPSTNFRMKTVTPLYSPKLNFKNCSSSRGFFDKTLPKQVRGPQGEVFRMFQHNLFVHEGSVYMLGGGGFGGYETNQLLRLEGRFWKEVTTRNAQQVSLYNFKNRKVVYVEDHDYVLLWDGLNFKNEEYVFKLDMGTKTWARFPQIDWIECYTMQSASTMIIGNDNIYVICIYNGAYDNYEMDPTPISQEEEESDMFGKIYSRKVTSDLDSPWEETEIKKVNTIFIDLLKDDSTFAYFSNFSSEPTVFFFWQTEGIQPIVFNLSSGKISILDFDPPHPSILSKPRHSDFTIDEEYSVSSLENPKKYIPILYCTHRYRNVKDGTSETRLVCLYNERYVLELDIREKKWVEICCLSNTRLVDGFISRSVQHAKSGSEEATNEFFMDLPTNPMGQSLLNHPQGLQSLNNSERRFCIHAAKEQFHSMVKNDRNGMLYLFTKSRYAPFVCENKSMVLVRLDGVEMRCMKENMLLFLVSKKERSFCDVVVKTLC